MRLILFLICSDEPAAQKWLVESGVARGDDESK
jgi:hypothetical protein